MTPLAARAMHMTIAKPYGPYITSPATSGSSCNFLNARNKQATMTSHCNGQELGDEKGGIAVLVLGGNCWAVWWVQFVSVYGRFWRLDFKKFKNQWLLESRINWIFDYRFWESFDFWIFQNWREAEINGTFRTYSTPNPADYPTKILGLSNARVRVVVGSVDPSSTVDRKFLSARSISNTLRV